jgi:hypothetical protein
MSKDQVASADLWRISAPVCKTGKYYSVIEDRGTLQKATANSQNNYDFSATGAGVKPLVIIGTPVQIVAYLHSKHQRVIVNSIPQLPQIYMGISLYKPQDRFTGLFPVHDFMKEVALYLSSFIPAPDVYNITNISGPLGDAIKRYHESKKSTGSLLYLKLSYLPEDNMVRVGQGKVSFMQLLKHFEQTMSKR